MSEEASKLAGVIDGVTMTEEAARLLWKEFSEHMDEKRGDMAGYAKKRGWFSVLPEYRGGKAVLIVKTTANAKGPPPVAAPQKPQQKQKLQPKAQAQRGAKPPQTGAAKPPAGQKLPQKTSQAARPNPQGGGGQAPPKKRPS